MESDLLQKRENLNRNKHKFYRIPNRNRSSLSKSNLICLPLVKNCQYNACSSDGN